MSGNDVLAGKVGFSNFTLDFARGALVGPNGEIRLRPKSFEVLCHLVRNHGRLVGKGELLDAVWGRTVVTEDSLTQCLVEIRRALGADARRIVRTVPRRGYLFEAQVSMLEASAPGPGQAHVAAHAPDDGAMPAAGAIAAATPGMRPGPTRTSRNPVRLLALLAGALLIAALGWWVLGDREPGPVELAPAPAAEVLPNSIAVLPFEDMSATQDKEYFGDGIAEEILNLLAQAPELKVIARTSSFSFKHQRADIATIAAKLRAEYLLEGSVRVSGERVRVMAQLIAASDGAHLWSESYDRRLGDLLEVQREIAEAVARVLHATLLDAPPHGDKRPVDPRAYALFLHARFLYQRRGPGDAELALEKFEAALAIDPEYAPAWAGLAGAYDVLSNEAGLVSKEVAMQRRMEAVERALALDPKLPEAHLRAAHVYFGRGEWETGMYHARVARDLDPDNLLLLGNLAGVALGQGDLEEAVALAGRVVTLDPLSRVARTNLASMLTASGRLDDARAQYLAVRDLHPAQEAEIDGWLAQLLVLEGRHAEALEVLRELAPGRMRDAAMAMALHALGRTGEAAALVSRLQDDADDVMALSLAEVYAQQGDFDTAFHWLATSQVEFVRRGPTGIYSWAQLAYVSAFLRPLQDDPRWAALHLGVDYDGVD